jgi:hypothetical protein
MLPSTDISRGVSPLAVVPPIVFHQVLDGISMEDMPNLSIGIVAAEGDGLVERDSLHGYEILPISLRMEEGLLPEFLRVECHLFGGFGFGAHDGVLDPGFGVLVRYVRDGNTRPCEAMRKPDTLSSGYFTEVFNDSDHLVLITIHGSTWLCGYRRYYNTFK